MTKKRQRVDATGRSVGESRHVRLYTWMLKTAAYRSLSPVARALLVELYALYGGENNGQLFLSVREAAGRINAGKDTVQRAFADLQERGFIRVNQLGSFSQKSRHATSWVLTEFSFAGQLATKDFARWMPSEKQNTVPVVRPVGTCSATVSHLRRVK